MKEWVTFFGCKGKTIEKLSAHALEQWLILFTDGTWTSIQTKYGHSEDYELMSERPDPSEIYGQLQTLGVIDATEAARLREEEKRKFDEECATRERAEYERLHAKFGKGI